MTQHGPIAADWDVRIALDSRDGLVSDWIRPRQSLCQMCHHLEASKEGGYSFRPVIKMSFSPHSASTAPCLWQLDMSLLNRFGRVIGHTGLIQFILLTNYIIIRITHMCAIPLTRGDRLGSACSSAKIAYRAFPNFINKHSRIKKYECFNKKMFFMLV